MKLETLMFYAYTKIVKYLAKDQTDMFFLTFYVLLWQIKYSKELGLVMKLNIEWGLNLIK